MSHRFVLRFVSAVALGLVSVKVPLGDSSSDPPLGSGSTDFLAGATVSRDALRSYLQLLVELNGVEQAQTGGTVLAVSPGFWLTRRNWALKGGLKLPFVQDLRGNQPELDYTVLLAIETHM